MSPAWPPERVVPFVFLLLALAIGCSYAFVVPPYEVPDELAHLLRTYDLSTGSCVGLANTVVPRAFLSIQWNPARLTLRPVLEERISDSSPTMKVNAPRANLYDCVPYAPGAIELAAARHFHLTVAHAFYLGRLANLGAYVGLVFLALRILPDFQVSLMGLALMPMTLHQAASFSPDALSMASSFLLIAYCFHLAFGGSERLRGVELASLCLLTLFASLCKFNLWLALLVLLIPTRRFGRPARRWLTLAACIALPCIAASVWQLWNEQNVQLFTAARLMTVDVDVRENARFLVHQPEAFFRAFERTMTSHRLAYWEMFIGRLGLLTVALPAYAIRSYGCLLGATILIGSGRIRLRIPQRALLLLIVAASILSLFSLLWTFETPRTMLETIQTGGVGAVNGVQGRYFIPFALPLLAALSWNRRWSLHYLTILTIALLILAVNLGALQAVWQSYYSQIAVRAEAAIPAWMTRYEERLLGVEEGRDQDKVYIVYQGKRYWITDFSWIPHHGFRWPEDLIKVPAAEFASIPEGPSLGWDGVIPFPAADASHRYKGLLVRQEPGPGPDEGKIFLVQGGWKHWVLRYPWIGEHGYRVPQDLVIVSREELNAIPTGVLIR